MHISDALGAVAYLLDGLLILHPQRAQQQADGVGHSSGAERLGGRTQRRPCPRLRGAAAAPPVAQPRAFLRLAKRSGPADAMEATAGASAWSATFRRRTASQSGVSPRTSALSAGSKAVT
ncbi:unnamed protein product [Prorocentrum cordatum]|uniref:Uncharacterized protein n=1 Tax=Prorocentrum cordatum TaxID=2364126 RepID=A0ABN9V8C8_9DINO|nr:unnamed protein product [Polarella glacialis]